MAELSAARGAREQFIIGWYDCCSQCQSYIDRFRKCDARCRASSSLLRNVLDAPTALAASCWFDLCHEYIWNLVYIYGFRWRKWVVCRYCAGQNYCYLQVFHSARRSNKRAGFILTNPATCTGPEKAVIRPLCCPHLRFYLCYKYIRYFTGVDVVDSRSWTVEETE